MSILGRVIDNDFLRGCCCSDFNIDNGESGNNVILCYVLFGLCILILITFVPIVVSKGISNVYGYNQQGSFFVFVGSVITLLLISGIAIFCLCGRRITNIEFEEDEV